MSMEEGVRGQGRVCSLKTTLVRILSIVQWLRNDAQAQESLEIPLDGVFGLPAPEHPAGVLAVQERVHLCLHVLSIVGHHVVGEVAVVSRVQLVARADIFCVGERGVVSCSSVGAVEPLGAVGESSSPLSAQAPVELCVFGPAPATGRLDVLVDRLLQRTNVKHLVMVVVHHHVPGIGVLLGVEHVVERVVWQVRVVDDHRSVAVVSHELLDANHHVRVLGAGVFRGDLVQNVHGQVHVAGGVLPANFSATARVVEPVLRARSTVQVNPGLKSVVSTPLQSLVQILDLALNVWVAVRKLERPVPNRQPHKVEASSGNVLEICFSYPRGPVLLQPGLCLVLAKSLCVMPLVHRHFRGFGSGLEQGGSDVGLQHEPSSDVDTVDLICLVVPPGVSLEEGERAGTGHREKRGGDQRNSRNLH
ncbi:hypothetical protein OGAPHI_002787 [Ogataea philodendri]|uniref:Uncharacterized protein n=1 Tax=Ogataea philodendri TaxID=1378263 RepID=A0A9P8P7U1_9ASCO|nr:uncharacterized protein OGAPHI_002787 [Ogataea philodendri]KAH3667138.1 hypothetical protein OGAPHI_002787 [Ogataea philodendri]